MKFEVLTLFPEMFEPINTSIIGRAIEKNLIEINLINIRDFSKDKHKKVDDTPYGGGAGMLMKPDVVWDAWNSVKSKNAKTIYMSPKGKTLTQEKMSIDNEKEKLMIKASEKYFSFYSNYLPKKVNDDTRVLLSALVLEKYLDDVKDIDGNSCDITKSYVEVEKTKEDEYLYKAHLVCDNYETKDGE